VVGLYRSPAGTYDASVMGEFPQQVGNFHMKGRWNSTLLSGTLIFYWADYENADGTVVSVGVSPVLGAHDTLICHAARGEDWLWHGNLPMPTHEGEVSFSGSFFSEGPLQYLEATTVCTGESCGQYSSDRQHFGLVYSLPKTNSLLNPSPTRPIPVMLRTQTTDGKLAPDVARQQLTASLHEFLAAADLSEFTRPYRKQ